MKTIQAQSIVDCSSKCQVAPIHIAINDPIISAWPKQTAGPNKVFVRQKSVVASRDPWKRRRLAALDAAHLLVQVYHTSKANSPIPNKNQSDISTQGERMNIFLENKLETAIALNMLSEFAMVDVAIYTIL
jgi:hypothetical protein